MVRVVAKELKQCYWPKRLSWISGMNPDRGDRGTDDPLCNPRFSTIRNSDRPRKGCVGSSLGTIYLHCVILLRSISSLTPELPFFSMAMVGETLTDSSAERNPRPTRYARAPFVPRDKIQRVSPALVDSLKQSVVSAPHLASLLGCGLIGAHAFELKDI